MLDIVDFAIQIHEELESWGYESFDSFLEQSERMSVTTIQELMTTSRRMGAKVISNRMNMRDVIKYLLDFDVRRILVLNEYKRLQNIITQSSILNFVWTEQKIFGGFLDEKLSKFRSSRNPVISVYEDDTTIEAFKLMRDVRISAVCVVDTSERLIGTISVKDLRVIVPGLTIMQRLYVPVSEFRKKMQRETGAPTFSITCTQESTLREILEKFQKNKIHRVWVVDDHNIPTDVVSLRDFLEILFLYS